MNILNSPPPGWYPDGQVAGGVRWWDGEAWTDDRRGPVAGTGRSGRLGGRSDQGWLYRRIGFAMASVAAGLVVVAGVIAVVVASDPDDGSVMAVDPLVAQISSLGAGSNATTVESADPSSTAPVGPSTTSGSVAAGPTSALAGVRPDPGAGGPTATAPTSGSTTPASTASTVPSTPPSSLAPTVPPTPPPTPAPTPPPTPAPTPAPTPPPTPAPTPTPTPTPPPTPAPTEPPTSGGCDPNYSGCVPIAFDVDCAGGGGNGPAYVQGPVQVIGSDIYDLDADNDGIGCEP